MCMCFVTTDWACAEYKSKINHAHTGLKKITANSFCGYDGRVGRQYIVPIVQKY